MGVAVMAYLTAIMTTALTFGTVKDHKVIVNKKVSHLRQANLLLLKKNSYRIFQVMSNHVSNLTVTKQPSPQLTERQKSQIVNSCLLPSDWETIIRSSLCKREITPIPHTTYIKLNCGSFPISDVTSKQIYDSVLRKKQIPPTAQQKITDKYSDTVINWKKVYSLPFRTTLDSKLREFQYKILNNIVFTNDKLFRFGLSHSPNCTFCNEEPESLEHLLLRCKVSSEFWKEVLSWLRENKVVIESFTEIGLLLGFFEETEDFFIINHVLLLGKYYIYVRKCLGSLPSLRGFITKIRSAVL